MKKVRYYYWITESIIKKHWLPIVAAAIIGAVTFTQIPRVWAFIPKPKSTHYVGRAGLYTLNTLPKDIQLLVSQGLTFIQPDGTPIPALAKDWKILDEGKTYVFTLREDAKWSDGTPLTSYEVSYSFEDVVLEIPDAQTLVFRLSEPFSPFPGIVSQPIFKRTTDSFANVYTTNQIIGTANYSITKVERNGNYLKEITLESKQNRLIYRFYNTEQGALTAYSLGEVDKLEDITGSSDFQSWPNTTITPIPNLQRYAAIFFNTQDPNLSDKGLRQALTYAVPIKEQGAQRAISPLSPESWAYNPKVKTYDHSLESAQALLESLNTNIEIELSTTPAFVALAEQVKTSWQTLGFTVKIKVVNLPDTNNYQALLIGQQIPKDPDQYLFWHSTQNSNITKYQSAKVDKLLEDGRKELDPQKRKLIYQDFQRYLVEDSPAAFLFHLNTYTIERT